MMERDYLDIIKEKEFIELNSTERTEIAEICATEEKFNAIKAMLLKVDSIVVEPITPNPKTKESLDSLFAQSYPKAAPIWYNSVFAVVIPKEKPIYRQPLVQIAAVFLIFWMVYPFFNSNLKMENKQLAKVEKQQDEKPLTETESAVETPNEAQQEVSSIPSVTNQQEPVRLQDEELPITTRSFAERSSAPGTADVVGFSAMSLEDEVVEAESTHPDGVFMASGDQSIAFGQSAKETTDLLDLLTATF